MRAFIRGFFGLDWPYTPFTRSPHIYFIVVYLFRSTDDVFLSLIPLVHVVDQEETGYGVGHRLSVSSPLTSGMGDAYGVKPVRTPVAILGSLGVCIYVPASRHWLISYSPIHLI